MSPPPLVVTEKKSVQNVVIYLVGPLILVVGCSWGLAIGLDGSSRGIPFSLSGPVVLVGASVGLLVGIRAYARGLRMMVADDYGMSGEGPLLRAWRVPWSEIIAVFPVIESDGPNVVVVVTTRPPSSGLLDRIVESVIAAEIPPDRECKFVDWTADSSMDMRTALTILQQRAPRHVRVTVC